jgi:predicted small secreted protein
MEGLKMKRLAALFALLALLVGCNTIEGIGKDVKKAGGVVEDAAKKK